MQDIPLKQIKEETGLGYPEIAKKMKALGIAPFLMKNKKHVEYEDYERFMRIHDLPVPLQPRFTKAKWIRNARNPKFIYVTVEGFTGKHLCLLPRRLRGSMENKKFGVEVIQDKDGVSFRHEMFAKKHMLRG